MPTFTRDTLGVDVVKAYAKVAAGKTGMPEREVPNSPNPLPDTGS